jgi:hypothetical protein
VDLEVQVGRGALCVPGIAVVGQHRARPHERALARGRREAVQVAMRTRVPLTTATMGAPRAAMMSMPSWKRLPRAAIQSSLNVAGAATGKTGSVPGVATGISAAPMARAARTRC